MIIKRSERLLDDENYKWSDDLKAKVGAYLVKVFIDTAETRSGDPAFNFVTKYVGKKKQQGFVQCDPSLFSSLMDASLKNSFHIRHLPMVVPPVPWTGPTTGSYLVNESVIMRTRGCRQQLKALEFADMSLVYDGLNALGSTPWRINTGILGLQMEAWRNKMTVGELPSQVSAPKAAPPLFAYTYLACPGLTNPPLLPSFPPSILPSFPPSLLPSLSRATSRFPTP